MRNVLLGCLLSLTALPLAAQNPPPPAPSATVPCTSAAYHAFDFWLGEWEVSSNGAVSGHNTIATSAGGCALSEHWRSVRGNEGRSLNAYDAAVGVWRQFWVGADGGVLRLSGGLRDGAMIMTGTLRTGNGKEQGQRISWTPRADGSVEQRWESSDDGVQWNVVFLGEYRRVREPEATPAGPAATAE